MAVIYNQHDSVSAYSISLSQTISEILCFEINVQEIIGRLEHH